MVTALRATMLLTLWLKGEGAEGGRDGDEEVSSTTSSSSRTHLQGPKVSHQISTSEKLHCFLIVSIPT